MPHAPLSSSSATRRWTFTPFEGPVACASVRLGVFGGTFDPPHVGHLVTAVNVRHALALDRVLLVVANVPWQKVGERTVSPAEDRLAMVEAAARGSPGSRSAGSRSTGAGPRTPRTPSGSFAEPTPGRAFPHRGQRRRGWVDHLGASRRGARAVQRRRGRPPWRRGGSSHHQGGGGQRVEVPRLDVSSTDLRARVADGRPLDFLLPPDVIVCIHAVGALRRP